MDNGKYEFIQRKSGAKVEILRYGERWMEFDFINTEGGNALMAALFELEELKDAEARRTSGETERGAPA